jgi:hypothetical protein
VGDRVEGGPFVLDAKHRGSPGWAAVAAWHFF